MRTALLFSLACNNPAPAIDAPSLCTEDTDCTAGFVCDTEAALCRCRTGSDVCGPGMFCNSFNACQTRPPCVSNRDCALRFLCNTADASGGACIAAPGCGSSVHCPFDSFCDRATAQCKVGCLGTGDCQLGYVCAAGQCQPGGTAQNCTLCPAKPEPDPTYCDYGEICSDAGVCEAHTLQSALCQPCGPEQPCPRDMICMIDSEAVGQSFCAASCRLDADCPAGYPSCTGIQMTPGDCTDDGLCPNGGGCLSLSESDRKVCECVSDEDCNPYAGMCNPFARQCFVGLCADGTDCSRFGPQASCSDIVDPATFELVFACTKPCSRDEDCICLLGRCALTEVPCTTAADCQDIACVEDQISETQTVRLCETQIKACGKTEATRCEELTAGVSSCRAP